MSENGADAPEVVQFEPKRQPRSYDTPVEEAGQAIVAKVRRAAELANETCDRAMRLAHKLSLELRAAEDRINQLEAEVQPFEIARPAPKVGFKQSTKRLRKSSSLRDQGPSPNNWPVETRPVFANSRERRAYLCRPDMAFKEGSKRCVTAAFRRRGAFFARTETARGSQRPDCVAGHEGLEVRRETGKE
jgi:hypothetical protein